MPTTITKTEALALILYINGKGIDSPELKMGDVLSGLSKLTDIARGDE